MSIQVNGNRIRVEDRCEADQAEDLLQAVRGNPALPVDISDCTYMHTAVFQVLFCLGVKIIGTGSASPIQDHLQPILAISSDSGSWESN